MKKGKFVSNLNSNPVVSQSQSSLKPFQGPEPYGFSPVFHCKETAKLCLLHGTESKPCLNDLAGRPGVAGEAPPGSGATPW